MNRVYFKLKDNFTFEDNFLPISNLPLETDKLKIMNYQLYIKVNGNYIQTNDPGIPFPSDYGEKFYNIIDNLYLIKFNWYFQIIEIDSCDKVILQRTIIGDVIAMKKSYIYYIRVGFFCCYDAKSNQIYSLASLSEGSSYSHYLIHEGMISFDLDLFTKDCVSNYNSNDNLDLFNYIRYKIFRRNLFPKNIVRYILIKKTYDLDTFDDIEEKNVIFKDGNIKIPKADLQKLRSEMINEQISGKDIYIETDIKEYQDQSLEFLDYIQSDLLYQKLDNLFLNIL